VVLTENSVLTELVEFRQPSLLLRSGDVGHHPRPKHFGFPLALQRRESEIVDAVFQSEKSIRGEPMESCKLLYFNSFEFFDHTGSPTVASFSPRSLSKLISNSMTKIYALSDSRVG